MPGIVLLSIAYTALSVFAVAVLCRTVRLARLPVHLRWELAPVPHEKGKNAYGGSYLEEYQWWARPRARSLLSELIYMFQEIVFLKTVWEHNRRLWWFSFPLHFGMYLLIASAATVFLAAILQMAGTPAAVWAVLRVALLTLAAAGYALGALGAVGLLVSRLCDPLLKASRSGASLFNLGFLSAVFFSGGWCLVSCGEFSERLTGLARAFVAADTSIRLPPGLAAHVLLVFLFLAYLPFTQMLHFVAKYFTYHRVRWDDEAMVPGSPMERQVLKLLEQSVTWSGPHLKADGVKNWTDIVVEEEQE